VTNLKLYLALESVVRECSGPREVEDQHEIVEALRDLMDRVWLKLSDEEHARLDARPNAGCVNGCNALGHVTGCQRGEMRDLAEGEEKP
jgi:hypothetical protein